MDLSGKSHGLILNSEIYLLVVVLIEKLSYGMNIKKMTGKNIINLNIIKTQ